MSHGSSPYTTVATLDAAKLIHGPGRVWHAVEGEYGARQAQWLEDRFRRLLPEIPLIPEIASNATHDAENHVAFIKSRGGEAQIKTCGPDEFLLASVMDLLGKWLTEGEADRMPDGKHGAAFVSGGVEIVKIRGSSDRVVRLTTRNGDVVSLEMAHHAPQGSAFSDWAAARYGQSMDVDGSYEGVIFPFFDFKQSSDHVWIKGLWTRLESGMRAKIIEYKSALSVKGNHVGFRAVAVDEMKGNYESYSPPPVHPPFLIDKPFVLSVSRKGLSLPLVSAYLQPDCWVDDVAL